MPQFSIVLTSSFLDEEYLSSQNLTRKTKLKSNFIAVCLLNLKSSHEMKNLDFPPMDMCHSKSLAAERVLYSAELVVSAVKI